MLAVFYDRDLVELRAATSRTAEARSDRWGHCTNYVVRCTLHCATCAHSFYYRGAPQTQRASLYSAFRPATFPFVMSPVPAFAAPAALPLRAASSLRASTSPLRTPAAPAAAGACAARMAFSSIQGVLTAKPVALPADANSVMDAMYKQMFGNAYLMESELAELAVAESTFRISRDTKEFVRAIGYSEAYKSRFFDPVSQYRFIELTFKHMLGRAPRSLGDYGEAMAAYRTGGVQGVVDWCVDSLEFAESFGSETVPYGEYKGCYPTNEEFNRSVAMRGTPSGSDKKRSTMLQYAVCSGDSPSWLTISKSLVPGTERGTGFCVGGHWTSTQRNKNAPVRVGTKIPGGVVFYG